MIKELSLYENLGTPQYFLEVLNILGKVNKAWTAKEVEDYFYNRIIEGRSIFDGCIPFVKLTEIIQIDKNSKVTLDPFFNDCLTDIQRLSDKIIERLFQKLKNDEIFYEIFNPQNISYDVICRSILINNSAFLFKYVNLKQLLIDFGFLLIHPDKQINKFIINLKYKNIFDEIVLPVIKKHKISNEELRKLLEQERIYGEEAEKFVLEYENQRLKNQKSIEWVAEYWINAGYDIISYNNLKSDKQDRFIEVKSYSGTPSFFWSRNEIEIAKFKKDEYFLYLVDRNQINDKGYEPIIIQNPYETVLKNDIDWSKVIEKYFITLNK